MLLAVIVPTLVLAAGLCLMRRACHRQEHIACRGCGYDLTGSPDSARCPECGRELDEAAIEPAGEIAVTWWLFWTGFMLVLGAALVLVPLIVYWAFRVL